MIRSKPLIDPIRAYKFFILQKVAAGYTPKVLNIQEMFLTGEPQYPVERTLLISGELEALVESRYRGHVRIETPHLDVRYRSYDKTPIRPTNPRPAGPSATPWRTAEKAG